MLIYFVYILIKNYSAYTHRHLIRISFRKMNLRILNIFRHLANCYYLIAKFLWKQTLCIRIKKIFNMYSQITLLNNPKVFRNLCRPREWNFLWKISLKSCSRNMYVRRFVWIYVSLYVYSLKKYRFV